MGDPLSNLQLLLLGVLRFIGRNWTLDDVSEANGISVDTNNAFLYLRLKMRSYAINNSEKLESLTTLLSVLNLSNRHG